MPGIPVPARILANALIFFSLDQASKMAAKQFLSTGHSLPILPGLFHLTLTYNTGAAFSMLRQQPQLLVFITVGIFLMVLGYTLSRKTFLRHEPLALALILGGALGNLADRILQGKVTDFFDVIAIRYPIFNVADCFIFIGVALMLLAHLRPHPGASGHGRA